MTNMYSLKTVNGWLRAHTVLVEGVQFPAPMLGASAPGVLTPSSDLHGHLPLCAQIPT